jgi:hypothetical protein
MRSMPKTYSIEVPLSRGGAQASAVAGVCFYAIKKSQISNLKSQI